MGGFYITRVFVRNSTVIEKFVRSSTTVNVGGGLVLTISGSYVGFNAWCLSVCVGILWRRGSNC